MGVWRVIGAWGCAKAGGTGDPAFQNRPPPRPRPFPPLPPLPPLPPWPPLPSWPPTNGTIVPAPAPWSISPSAMVEGWNSERVVACQALPLVGGVGDTFPGHCIFGSPRWPVDAERATCRCVRTRMVCPGAVFAVAPLPAGQTLVVGVSAVAVEGSVARDLGQSRCPARSARCQSAALSRRSRRHSSAATLSCRSMSAATAPRAPSWPVRASARSPARTRSSGR